MTSNACGSRSVKRLLLGAVFAFWYAARRRRDSCSADFAKNTAPFFFGKPLEVLQRDLGVVFRRQDLPASGHHASRDAARVPRRHAAGPRRRLVAGAFAARLALADPYINAMNAMPRVILAPIFAVWFGLGITSKVALGVTLVFFIVFFNVYQGVKEVSPVVLANARMLGASKRQLLRYIYLPSATSWVFSSLHTSVGMAFVGAVVGEYLGLGKRRRLPDPAGRRRVRHQHGVRGHPRADRLCALARLDRHESGRTLADLAAPGRGDGSAVECHRIDA